MFGGNCCCEVLFENLAGVGVGPVSAAWSGCNETAGQVEDSGGGGVEAVREVVFGYDPCRRVLVNVATPTDPVRLANW